MRGGGAVEEMKRNVDGEDQTGMQSLGMRGGEQRFCKLKIAADDWGGPRDLRMWCKLFSTLFFFLPPIFLPMYLVHRSNTKNFVNTNVKISNNIFSYLGSSRPSPRGRCCRHSGPVAPASLRQLHSTAWACPALLHSPHTRPSLPPGRTSPCVERCQETPPGSSESKGSACRRPEIEENKRKLKRLRDYKFVGVAHVNISHCHAVHWP